MKARPSLRLPHGGQGKQYRGRVVVPSRLRCSCQKLGYTSRKQAKGAAAVSSRETGEHIHAYYCVPGHCWHIGHPPGSRGRPIPPPEETHDG